MDEKTLETWTKNRLQDDYTREDVADALEERGFDRQKAYEVEIDDPDSDRGTDYSFKQELDEKEEKLELTAQRIEKSFDKEFKDINIKSIIILLAAVATIGLFFYIGGFSNFKGLTNQLQDTVEVGEDKPQIEGNFTEVKLKEISAEPSRPTISEKDGIKFTNIGPYILNMTFDTKEKYVVLEQNETEYMTFDRITYYTAKPQSPEGRNIKGGINIQ